MNEKERMQLKIMLACAVCFIGGMVLMSRDWTSSGHAGPAKSLLRSGGDDMRQIVAAWCDYNKVLVINPYNQKWEFLHLEGQCAKSCDPHVTHVRIGRSLECEWLNGKPSPKPLIPEKPKITPAVSAAKGGARCLKRS